MVNYTKIVNLSSKLWKSNCQSLFLARFQSTEAALIELFQPGNAPNTERDIIRDPIPIPKKTKKEKADVIIKCNRTEFNHHRNQTYDKFKPIPLASKGWHHTKSQGDFFSIHVYNQDYEVEDLFWQENSTFQNFKFDEVLIKAIESAGYEKPTKIQVESIPVLLSGKNTIIAAETGCGKTLAFLLPVLQQILRWKQESNERDPNSPLVLILTPSRELATQIGNVARELCHHLPINCNVLTGGNTKKKMLNPDFRDIDLQIATLGAISKLVTTGIYNVKEVKHLVIDESDSMLDDSFAEALLRFLRKFNLRYMPSGINPNGCQLTLASATYPANFYEILSDFIEPDSFEKVTSKSLHRFLPHVPQMFYRLAPTQKPQKLLNIAKNAMSKKQPTIIFSNKSSTCDWISLMLYENGVEALNLNGEMPVIVRLGKFEQFQRGEVNILSCTDIASRGLDTKHVKHVVNYDFPLYMADYIHRCGRTGRCGSSRDCQITNFVSGYREVELVNKIEMAVRCMEALPNVNGNITKIIRNRIAQSFVT